MHFLVDLLLPNGRKASSQRAFPFFAIILTSTGAKRSHDPPSPPAARPFSRVSLGVKREVLFLLIPFSSDFFTLTYRLFSRRRALGPHFPLARWGFFFLSRNFFRRHGWSL